MTDIRLLVCFLVCIAYIIAIILIGRDSSANRNH